MDDLPATQMVKSTRVMEATRILSGDEGEEVGHVVVGLSTRLWWSTTGLGRTPGVKFSSATPALAED